MTKREREALKRVRGAIKYCANREADKVSPDWGEVGQLTGCLDALDDLLGEEVGGDNVS